ncbi:Bifunctional phosphatase IMPL2, chloroplastic [Nymphon striatum]|nr:Bifunctional phosphatase IMPL2, chloroplastic [Nymphon striatum]
MNTTPLDLAFLERLANAAAEQTLQFFRAEMDVENKFDIGFDPVTEGDKRAEKAIRAIIEECFPDHGILGEEYGAKNIDRSHVWVIDPIDGTRAFIAGVPVWGTLMAVDGSGKQKILETSNKVTVADAIMFTTSPKLYEGKQRDAFDRLEDTVKLCRYGTDCYGAAMVAAGHADIWIEPGLQPYDVVGIIPVIEQAGGIITTGQNCFQIELGCSSDVILGFTASLESENDTLIEEKQKRSSAWNWIGHRQTFILSNHYDRVEKQRDFLETLMQLGADGVIMSPAIDTPKEDMDLLTKNGLPIARSVPGVELPVFRGDDKFGTSLATNHLISLGHKRIAMIGGTDKTSTGRDRYEGYMSAMRKAGLEVKDEWRIEGPRDKAAGFEAASQFLALPDKLTAAVCWNDLAAIGLMNGISRAGLRPGIDISVTGYDDLEEAAIATPALTTVWNGQPEVGRLAARALLDRIEGKRQMVV